MVQQEYSANLIASDCADIDTEMKPHLDRSKVSKNEFEKALLAVHRAAVETTKDIRTTYLRGEAVRTNSRAFDIPGFDKSISQRASLDSSNAIRAWDSLYAAHQGFLNHATISQLGLIIDAGNYEHANAEKITMMQYLFANLSRKDLHAVERAVLAIAGIENIKPLRTGNQRLERLIAQKILLDAQLPPCETPFGEVEYRTHRTVLASAARALSFDLQGKLYVEPQAYVPFARQVAGNIYGNIGALATRLAK